MALSKEITDAAQRLKDAIHKDSHYPAGWIGDLNLLNESFEAALDMIINQKEGQSDG